MMPFITNPFFAFSRFGGGGYPFVVFPFIDVIVNGLKKIL